jgi:hypothetical protein
MKIGKLYAARFTEAELKERLTSFQSPLGKKVLQEEPRFVEASARTRRRNGPTSCPEEVMVQNARRDEEEGS